MTALDPLGRIGRRELEERLRLSEEENARLRDELADLRAADPTLVGWHCAHCGLFNDERVSITACGGCGQDAPTTPLDAVSRIADLSRVVRIFDAIRDERRRQDEKHGPISVELLAIQPGTGGALSIAQRERARLSCSYAFGRGEGTWRHLLSKRVTEVFAERTPAGLRPRLVRLAAMAVRWIEVIDEYAEDED